MIGRALLIFQRGNNQNELHSVSSWEFALAPHEDEEKMNKAIIEESEKEKWKPEAIVSDAEVEAIVNSKHCADSKEPGYHEWCSDGYHIINLSGDPTLPNPLTPLEEAQEKEGRRRVEARKQLDKFIPELIKLRQAVPEGSVEIAMAFPVTIRIRYGVGDYHDIDVLDKQGKKPMYPHELINHAALAQTPEMVAIESCPLRKAYRDRCHELAELLGFDESDIENQTYFAIKKEMKGGE